MSKNTPRPGSVAFAWHVPQIRGMNDALAITCPHCGENFSLAFDESEGSAEFVIDCEVCCRPMTVAVKVNDGAVDGVEVTEC